jgi:hypothetical protein
MAANHPGALCARRAPPASIAVGCESWERCQSAREQLASEGLTVAGREGGLRPHPCVGIERDARLAVARLVRELDLDTEPGQSQMLWCAWSSTRSRGCVGGKSASPASGRGAFVDPPTVDKSNSLSSIGRAPNRQGSSRKRILRWAACRGGFSGPRHAPWRAALRSAW